MSIGLLVSLAAFVAAAAPQEGEGKLEKYGGSFSCKDQAVKEQVVQALSSGKTSYGSSAITLAKGTPQFDGNPVDVTFGKATAVVSKPGSSAGPSGVRVVRSGEGAAMDLLICRYRRPSNKAWDKVTAADLQPNGQMRKRIPAGVKMVGRTFAPSDLEGQSNDFVKVVVASGVGNKPAPTKVRVLTKGLQKGKRKGAAKGGKDIGKKILAEATDKSWEKYKYKQVVVFPEAAGKVWDHERKEFDCSYYSWLVYERAGIGYTHTGTEGLSLLGNGEFVEVKTPRPGDLVVWNPAIGSKINHVGIIAEDTSTFWDNSKSEDVGLSKLSWSTYQDKHIFIRRKGL